jgi:hypothetical protein
MSKKWEQIPLELPVVTEVKPTVWVLTSDAYGWDVFEYVFGSKPTLHQLIDIVDREDHAAELLNTGSTWTGWVIQEVTLK